eukprot:5371673-Pleurochrysis_carterae.AAC.1
MLELFLGPSLSIEEKGSGVRRHHHPEPTYEQQLQRQDVARFIHMEEDPESSKASTQRVCLYNLLAMYGYVEYGTLLSHIYLAGTDLPHSASDVAM